MADQEQDVRLFGRVRAALVECPQCGEISDLRAGASETGRQKGPRRHLAGEFDPLTARWRCRCGFAAVVGVVIYKLEEGDRDGRPPRDWIAGIREAARLREVGRARISGESWAQRRRWRGANQVRGGSDGKG